MDSHAADERLMAQAARGSRESMDLLVRRYAGPLLTFLQRMIANRHRAEDLFQEVFLAVWTQRRECGWASPGNLEEKRTADS